MSAPETPPAVDTEPDAPPPAVEAEDPAAPPQGAQMAEVVDANGLIQPVPTPMSWTVAPQPNGVIVVVINTVTGSTVLFLTPDYVAQLIGQFQQALRAPARGLVVAPANAMAEVAEQMRRMQTGKR